MVEPKDYTFDTIRLSGSQVHVSMTGPEEEPAIFNEDLGVGVTLKRRNRPGNPSWYCGILPVTKDATEVRVRVEADGRPYTGKLLWPPQEQPPPAPKKRSAKRRSEKLRR